MTETVLLGLSGALRAGSLNTKLVREAAMAFGADRFVLADLRLPLYDGDLETGTGIPEGVRTLAGQIRDASAVVISTPEYNQSLSGVLKNALDWVSRVEGKPWLGKPVALLSAAAGRSGGARANYALRLAMQPFKPRLLQTEVLVASASAEFNAEGRLLSDRYRAGILAQMNELRAEAGLPALRRTP